MASDLQQQLKISALSYALQKTGMTKSQADIAARQELQKDPNIQVPMQAGFGSDLFTPTNMIIAGVAIAAVVGFIAYSGGSKSRR